jgi:protein-disulfide isomerase
MSMASERNLFAALRLSWYVIVGLLFTSLAGAASAQQSPAQPALTQEQTQAIQQLIHDYLLNNPGVVFQALKNQQEEMEREKQATAQDTIVSRQQDLVADPTSPTGGNPHGDVTVVEFFDYRCPYCKAVEPSLEALLKDDAKLRIVYKEFPILGPASVYAAQVALAAQKQGKYKEFHNAMMATKGNIDEVSVLGVARLAGLDLDQVKADVNAPEIAAIIRRNYELAQALNIGGTPGFVIGSEVADGAADTAALKRMVATARQSE